MVGVGVKVSARRERDNRAGEENPVAREAPRSAHGKGAAARPRNRRHHPHALRRLQTIPSSRIALFAAWDQSGGGKRIE
jgi:hypothetical protein